MCTKRTVYVYKKDGLRVQKGRFMCTKRTLCAFRGAKAGAERWDQVQKGGHEFLFVHEMVRESCQPAHHFDLLGQNLRSPNQKHRPHGSGASCFTVFACSISACRDRGFCADRRRVSSRAGGSGSHRCDGTAFRPIHLWSGPARTAPRGSPAHR